MMKTRKGLTETHDDSGIALVSVLGIGLLLVALVITAVTLSLVNIKNARTDQHWNAAVAAAYAGVEEYRSHLTNDPAYKKYGNPDSPFSATSESLTLPTGKNENLAFTLGSGGKWVDIPGSGGKSSFRYEVDNSKFVSTGILRVRSTGRVGQETRTIIADLKRQSFLDYLYFTNFEIEDISVTAVNPLKCPQYAWAGRPYIGCREINFANNDVINGPVHSNDRLRICNATFNGTVTTSFRGDNTGLMYLPRNSAYEPCTGAKFKLPNSPRYAPVIGLPETNAEILSEVHTDLADNPSKTGCLFTGPTKIKYNQDGTMFVRSPWTKFTNLGSTKADASNPGHCGTPGAGPGTLGDGMRIKVPEDNVIYVQNVPRVESNPNWWPIATSTATSRLVCTNPVTPGGGTGGGGSSSSKPVDAFGCVRVPITPATPTGPIVTVAESRPAGLRCGGEAGSSGKGNGLGYPMANERTPRLDRVVVSYGCRNGDVFVEGKLRGRQTVAAENYVYIVGNLEYNDSQQDMLGLIGNNSILVWNPVDSAGNTLLKDQNRTVNAALLSVSHSVRVQNYRGGAARGKLSITGAIAQKYRGIVGTATTGYVKDYRYDERLRFTEPPKFLKPSTNGYSINSWVETSPAMSADGSLR